MISSVFPYVKVPPLAPSRSRMARMREVGRPLRGRAGLQHTAASPCPGPAGAGARGSRAAAGPAGTRSALDAWGAGCTSAPPPTPLTGQPP